MDRMEAAPGSCSTDSLQERSVAFDELPGLLKDFELGDDASRSAAGQSEGPA
jgi:hypothetical protein